MPEFRVGERVRIIALGGAHSSWLGVEGEIREVLGRYVDLKLPYPDGDVVMLRWDSSYLESVEQDHAEAIRVLGEDYFA